MTAVGKVLTFLNLFCAVALLSWSASAYLNRLDWIDSTDAEKNVAEGQITKMDKEIKKLSKSIADTQTGYGERRVALEKSESDRDYRRIEFKKRLETARNDLDPANGSFREQRPQTADKPGGATFTDLEIQGPVITGPDGKKLRGLKALQEDYNREAREAVRWMNGRKVTPEEAALFDKVPGITAAELAELIAPPKEKGDILGFFTLRDLHSKFTDRVAVTNLSVEQQRVIAINLRDEARFLGDNRINWIVQLQTLERRSKQLEVRLAEFGAKP